MTYFSMPHGIVGEFVLHSYYWLQCLRMSKKSKEFDKHLLHIRFVCKFVLFVTAFVSVRNIRKAFSRIR